MLQVFPVKIMAKLFVLVGFCAALSLGYEIVQDEQGQEYYLLPVSRVRRADTDWNVDQSGRFNVEHRQTLINNDKEKLDAAAFGSQNLRNRHEPPTLGGKFDYQTEAGHGLSVQAQQMKRQGTDLGLQGKYNLYNKGPVHVDVTGEYQRHFGGPQGTQHPEWNAMLNGRIDI